MAGSNLAALFAGHIPKNNQTRAEKNIEPRIALNGIENIQSLNSVNINKKTINNNNPSAVHIFRFFNFLSGIIKLIYQSITEEI